MNTRRKYVPRKYFDGFPDTYSWDLDEYSRLWGIGEFRKKEPLKRYEEMIPFIKHVAH